MSGSKKVRHVVSMVKRVAILALIWSVLAHPHPEVLGAGFVVVPLAAWLSFKLLPSAVILDLPRFVVMLPGFVYHSIAGGIDVAWRAFHPKLPLKPGWVRRDVALTDMGKVALGAELSLMPGTLAAGSHDGQLLIHQLNTDQDIDAIVKPEEIKLQHIIRTEETSS